MTMNWEPIWARVRGIFQQLADDVARVNAAARSTSGRTATDVFPFGAYLSFSRSGEPGAEDLVVSVDCKRDDEALVLSCDIARGDGDVLAEAPAVTVGLGEDAPARAVAAILAWLVGVEEFVASHRMLVCRELASDTEAR